MSQLVVPAFFGLLLLSGLTAAAAPVTPSNVLLSRGRTEPVVAVDPAKPSIIVAGSNTNYSAPVNGTDPTGYFTSHDGGRSFTAGNIPLLAPYATGADPSIAIASNGTVYFDYLGETPAYCSSGHSAVLLSNSTDGGRSFRTPVLVDANPADDKPYLALENVSGRRPHLFVTWTRWLGHGSEIWYARSLDGGQTFSRPARLYAGSLDDYGSLPVVGPHGRVYVFWAVFPEGSLDATSRTEIFMTASRDDGAHFSAARRVVGPFWAIPRTAEPGSLRDLTEPAAAVAGNGAIFLAWASASRDRGHGVIDANINLIRSRDGGAHWSAPRRVNDVTRGDRFMPAISALSDGSIGLAFYDRRDGSWNLGVYAVHASFLHGFHASRNVRVSSGTSPISDIYYYPPGSNCFAPGRFFGDYIGTSAAGKSTMCVVWADTQLHVSSETDVWFAKISLPGLPSKQDVAVRRSGWRRLWSAVVALFHTLWL